MARVVARLAHYTLNSISDTPGLGQASLIDNGWMCDRGTNAWLPPQGVSHWIWISLVTQFAE